MTVALFNKSLYQKVNAILRRSNGSLYVPSPANVFQDSAGTTPGGVDLPAGYIKDLVGTNHATQAAAGFKPILRGAVKNLLLNSASLSTQTVSQATSGLTWTLAFEGSGTVIISGGYSGTLVGGSGRVSLTFTTTAAVNNTFTVTGTVTNAQLELGSVANAWVPTTSSPASSSYGPYWLDFDGVNDYMSASGWSSIAPLGGSPSVFIGVGTSTVIGYLMSYGGFFSNDFRGIGVWGTTWRTVASTDFSISETTYVPAVYTERTVSATNVTARKNSIPKGASTGATTENTTATSLFIGARGPSISNIINGGIFGIIAIPAAISDKELLSLEKYLAIKSGISI